MPAAALTGSLVADRLGIWRMMTPGQWIMDIAVLMLCAARPWFGFPPVSGHAVFSIHAIMTGRSVSTMVLAIASLLITLFAKIVLWGWDVTLWPGLALGVLSGWCWKAAAAEPSEKLTKQPKE